MSKVLKREQELECSAPTGEDHSSQQILIVSCYGNDNKLLETTKNYKEDSSHNESFKNQSKLIFQYVKKLQQTLVANFLTF